MNFSNYQNLRDLFTAIKVKFTNRPETIEISQADYNALTPAQKTDKTKVYYIYDAESGGNTLAGLSDTSITNPSNKQVLSYNSTTSKWENTAPPASGGVTDVEVNGTSVVDAQGVANLTITMPNIENLNNVDVTDIANGQVLKYNSTAQKWENANESGGGGGSSTLEGLDDVTISSPAAGNILAYDGEKWINYNASSNGMFIAAYGKSTYAEILAAYQSHMIVYCRASSGSNPASGAQTRMAFMAYVNNETTPTEFEFQYYRSVSTHSDSQQGDQVFVYKINSTGNWSVTTRNAFTKIKAGTNMTSSYSDGTLTLNSTASGGTTVVANPSGTASADLNKLQVGSSIYGIPQSTANPSGTATDNLTKIQIGNTIYAIPSANLGDVDNFVLVNDLPSDAASHPRTMYLITEE